MWPVLFDHCLLWVAHLCSLSGNTTYRRISIEVLGKDGLIRPSASSLPAFCDVSVLFYGVQGIIQKINMRAEYPKWRFNSPSTRLNIPAFPTHLRHLLAVHPHLRMCSMPQTVRHLKVEKDTIWLPKPCKQRYHFHALFAAMLAGRTYKFGSVHTARTSLAAPTQCLEPLRRRACYYDNHQH